VNGKDIRVGVIGTGIGARAVAPAFEATEGCAVVALASPRDEDAVTELCGREDFDLISVQSPPFLHRDHVVRAVEHGHAVLCDKPFGVNEEDAEVMHDLADDAEVFGLVNYEFRYAPPEQAPSVRARRRGRYRRTGRVGRVRRDLAHHGPPGRLGVRLVCSGPSRGTRQYTETLLWVALVRDAVRDGHAFPHLPTFAGGLACARVMDRLTGAR
jgi:hypothetical protein